jgi:molecular chaperone Hsp33
MNTDKCLSFYLNNGTLKGHFCRLTHSTTEALKNHSYPKKINKLLAEMTAISQCFTMDIKSDTQATMQLTGTSPVKLALVNSINCESFRCCATLDSASEPDLEELSVPQLFGQKGMLVFTIDFENQHYQTIIELSASNLQECFQHYFIQSQQIPTIVMLCSAAEEKNISSAALILQRIPTTRDTDIAEENDVWLEASCLASTVKHGELLNSDLPMEKFIHLVFGSLTPIVSRETHLTFKCTCNHEKIVSIVKNFDSQNPGKEIVVICEYCNKKYAIDKNEIDS